MGLPLGYVATAAAAAAAGAGTGAGGGGLAGQRAAQGAAPGAGAVWCLRRLGEWWPGAGGGVGAAGGGTLVLAGGGGTLLLSGASRRIWAQVSASCGNPTATASRSGTAKISRRHPQCRATVGSHLLGQPDDRRGRLP